MNTITSVKQQLTLEAQRQYKEKNSYGFENNLRSEVLEKITDDSDQSPQAKNKLWIESVRQAEMTLTEQSPKYGASTHRSNYPPIQTQGSASFQTKALQTEPTHRLSTEDQELQLQLGSDSTKTLENMLLSPKVRQQRKKVLRAVSSKEFRSEPQLILQESPHKMTADEKTRTKLLIHKNKLELTATQTLSRSTQDSVTFTKLDPSSSPLRSNHRTSLPNKISMSTVTSFRPYVNKEALSAFRRANLSQSSKESLLHNSTASQKMFEENHQIGKLAKNSRGWATDRLLPNRHSWRSPQLRPEGVNTQDLEIFGNATRFQTFYSIDSAEEKENNVGVEEKKLEIPTQSKQAENTLVAGSPYCKSSTRSSSQGVDPTEMANLELGAPWSKKKANLRLNLHNLKPIYFVESKHASKAVTSTTDKTTRRQESTQETESRLYSLLLTSEKEKKTEQLDSAERLKNSAMRACMISSRHNMFRRKPKRLYVAETNYNLASQFLSETARK